MSKLLPPPNKEKAFNGWSITTSLVVTRVCACAGMSVYRHIHVKAHMERSEGTFLMVALSLYLVSPKGQTRVMSLGSMRLTRGDSPMALGVLFFN